VSKVNFATDLELAFLNELGLKERTNEAASSSQPPEALERGVQAVRKVVEDKIVHFLASGGHAQDYQKV
jgi:fructose-bisphosphate aldolase class II